MKVSYVAILFLTGVLIFQCSSALPGYAYLLLLPLLFGLSIRYPWSRSLLVIIIAYTWTHCFALTLIYPKISSSLEGKVLTISGMVREVRANNPDYVKVLFQLDNTSLKRFNYGIPDLVLLNWYQVPIKVKTHQLCHLQVKLKRFRRLANPGTADWEKTMFLRGIGARGYIREGNCDDPPADYANLSSLRAYLIQKSGERVQRYENTGTMQALTYGVRENLTQGQWEILHETGTAHLLAISGLHISSIAFIVFVLVRTVAKTSAWMCNHISAQRLASILALICAGFYAYLAGFSLPTQRAFIMVAVVLLAAFFYRPVVRLSVLSTALLLILICNPMSVLYPGFWLSFGAVIFIYIAIRIHQHSGRMPGIIFIQIYLGAALFPLGLLFFQQGSLIAPVANLLAVPWVSFLVLPLLLCAQLIFVLGFHGVNGLFTLVNLLLEMLWWGLELIAGFRYSSVSDYVTIFSVLVYQLGLLMLILCKSLSAKAMGLIYVSALFFIKEPGLRQHEMRMTVLDVGQGLSVLIETENHSLLYDAGFRSSSGFSMGQAVVSPYLDARKIQKVDIGLVSHNDNDHSGGIHYLLNKNRIKKLLISNQRTLYEYDHKDYCRTGNEWNWDGVVFRVLHPASDWRSNDNNRSCVLQVIHPQGKILLTGDIEGSTEKVLSDLYGDKLASDILIVPHHGSKSSSTPGFLARVQPRFAVFSTAYKNRYDFPHADIIKRYCIMGVVTADTQSEGAVMFNIDSTKGIQMSQGYRAISQRYWHSSANRSNQGY